MMALVGGAKANEVEYPSIAKSIAYAIEGNFTIWEAAMATQSTGQPYSYMLGCLDYHTNETYAQWSNRQRAQTALVGFDYNGPAMADYRFLQYPKWPAKVVNPPKPLDIADAVPALLAHHADYCRQSCETGSRRSSPASNKTIVLYNKALSELRNALNDSKLCSRVETLLAAMALSVIQVI